MAKPRLRATPADRADKWKKLWGTPKPLADDPTLEAFETFIDAFVPHHMHKQFRKQFGVPKTSFGNRFFQESAVFKSLDTKLVMLVGSESTHVEATVLYGTPDSIEGWALRGETRRSLKDLLIDDWQEAAAIVRTPQVNLFVFVEERMKGCIVYSDRQIEPEF